MLYFSCTTHTHVHTCMGAWKEYRESISLTCITYYKLCCLVCKTFRSVLNDICLMNDQIASQFCMCVCLSFSVAVCLSLQSLSLSHSLLSLFPHPSLSLCVYEVVVWILVQITNCALDSSTFIFFFLILYLFLSCFVC